MRRLLAVLCAILIFIATGEFATRFLQHEKIIYNFSNGEHNVGVKRFETFSPKLIKSDNPVLYIENDPSDPLVNSFGMRGAPVSIAKPENTYRIAVIGDSVSYGFGVKLEESFSFILDKSLNSKKLFHGKNVEVLNFSVNGYGLEAYREVLLKKIVNFNPDIIVIGYCLNDFSPTDSVFIAVGDVMKKNASYKNLSKYSQFLAATKFYADKIWVKVVGEWQFRRWYKDPQAVAGLESNFRKIQAFGIEHNVPVLVVIFPLLTDFKNYGLFDIHDVVNSMLENIGLSHIDLLERFSHQPAEYWRLNNEDVTHPNAAGHQLIARAIEDVLLNPVTATPQPLDEK